jgi:hypothetical protein
MDASNPDMVFLRSPERVQQWVLNCNFLVTAKNTKPAVPEERLPTLTGPDQRGRGSTAA